MNNSGLYIAVDSFKLMGNLKHMRAEPDGALYIFALSAQ